MRIVTWNMQAAFGSDKEKHQRGWHYLAALDPDVALLQEVSPPEWAKQEWQIHYERAYRDRDWGSAVLVKDGLHSWSMNVPDHLRHPKHEGSSVVLTEVQAGMEKMIACSIYASAWKLKEEQLLELAGRGVDLETLRYGGVKDIWPLYLIFDELGRVLQSHPFVLGGDFNAARLMDQFSYMAGGNVDFFSRIESSGFHNMLGPFHEGEVRTYFKENKQPYQLDHMYCDATLLSRLKDCRVVDHPAAVLDLSDHAPVVAEFA